MPVLPPLFRQEKSDNCAITCLRMILAYRGIQVSEPALEQVAIKEPGGVHIEELLRLALCFGLPAEIEALDIEGLEDLLAHEIFPIVYLNRAHFEKRGRVSASFALRKPIVHSVIPVGVSTHFVTFLDPRPGRSRRISKEVFGAAQQDLGCWCLVCRPR